ncbi:hypothetical protein M758_6G021600 [Ceratodon purpureus]|nr:hypothetical protein M758_6G021600 [Ceratodon purpureus]
MRDKVVQPLKQPNSTGVSLREGSSMEDMCDEVLIAILKKLPLRDAIRARAVCRRWRSRMEGEEGYHAATGEWEPLPSLANVPRVSHLLPILGSGNGLLGFKIVSEFWGYIIVNPCSQKWTILPKTTDCWGDSGLFMTSDEQDQFRVVAVRDEDTHIYKSELDVWTKVGHTPYCVLEGQVVCRIKAKIGTVIWNHRLYTVSADGNKLISFDVITEKWTDDAIDIPVPNSAKETMQLLECADNLFAVTEDEGIVAVWGFGRQFLLVAEMPLEIQHYMKPEVSLRETHRSRKHKLKSVGKGHQIFIWRQKHLSVVAYDLFTRKWCNLPGIARPSSCDLDDDSQLAVDVSFFEPKTILDWGGPTLLYDCYLKHFCEL